MIPKFLLIPETSLANLPAIACLMRWKQKLIALPFFHAQQKDVNYYKAALSTYDSAFALADYIKKSIDNDEARFFIADKVFDAYSQGRGFFNERLILITAKKKMIHALEWISKSRATSLAISLKENTIKKFAGLPDSLLNKERNIKISISRLKFQLQSSTDSCNKKICFQQ
jgi:hypothetical protein